MVGARFRCAIAALCALGESGCFAMAMPGSEAPSFSSWDVDERVGLPQQQSAAATRTTQPTRVVVIPKGTTLASADHRRVLCSGERPCDLMLAPGSHELTIYEDLDAEAKPKATFWLDVDERPVELEMDTPDVALPYAGATLAIVGLLSVVFGAVAKETDGDDAVANALLFGGAAAAVTGLTLGFIYWQSGQGDVQARPLASP